MRSAPTGWMVRRGCRPGGQWRWAGATDGKETLIVSTEVLQLLDDFEQLVNGAVPVPMSSRRMLDERRCLDLLDQMRVLVPEEIRQARRIQQDRERILTD